MVAISQPPSSDRPAFPVKSVAIGIAVMTLLLSVSTTLTWQMGKEIRRAIQAQISVLSTAERVAHYGDILELSIKAVVSTGDDAAAHRYRTIQPQLRRKLNDLRGAVQVQENVSAVREVDDADLALIAMEYQALALADQGKITEARAIINSRKYDHLADVYRQGLRGIEQRARLFVDTTENDLRWYLRIILALSFASFILIALAWLLLVRPARTWGQQLEAARARAENAARQLAFQKAELKMLNRMLFDQARIDPLTKLNTRLKLAEDLELVSARVSRYGERYYAVMCDVDYFKQYNDHYGHVAGDEVLRRVANALFETCRGGDRVYRYGGEEFLIIMPCDSPEDAKAGAERHRAAVEALQIPHEGSTFEIVTISMGLAGLGIGGREAAAAWLEEADAALYRAKRAGRNRIDAPQPTIV